MKAPVAHPHLLEANGSLITASTEGTVDAQLGNEANTQSPSSICKCKAKKKVIYFGDLKHKCETYAAINNQFPSPLCALFIAKSSRKKRRSVQSVSKEGLPRGF